MRYLKLVILVSAYALIPARVCANLLPNRLRARRESVRDHRSALDQMHSHPLRRGYAASDYDGKPSCSKPVRRVLWRPDLCGPSSACAAVHIDEPDQSTARRGDQYVNALTRNAQFSGCRFEDDAGRAEDQRTGLSCPERQAVLAKQCLKRCADYASATTRCAGMDPNSVWHMFFGDISGGAVGSARVERCGPTLRASVSSRRQPPPRSGP